MNDYMMFDLSAFGIFVTLIVSNISQHIVKGKTNFLYNVELGICSLTILLRITYQIILRVGVYSHALVTLATAFIYSSLIVHSLIYPIGIYFVFSSVGILPLIHRSSTLKISMLLLSLIPVIYIIMDIISHTLFTISADMTLIWLRPLFILDLCIIVILIFGLALILYYNRILEKNHVINCVILFPINIGLYFIQSLFPQTQLEMFVLSITCYVIFTTIQRPELLINPETHAQSSFAFENEIKKNLNADSPMKIIYIQISNSKNVSTYIGNERFSSLLKKVTLYLRSVCKKEKLNTAVYYLNDYVFALPTEGQTDKMIEDALNTLERYFSQVFITETIKINLEVRMMVLCCPEDTSNFALISQISHSFFDNVKYSGRPQWFREFAADKNFIIKNNLDVILNRAIENKSFDVFYQPIFNVLKKKFASAEALVRLHDNEFGNIPPSIFIEHAERTNQIHIIGDFVLEKVCEFIGSKEGKALGLDYIEVNLSTAQCMETDLVEKIRDWLYKYNVDPANIRLEITESAASFNPQIVEKNIYSLNKMGIKFALDDYGTGYSNIKKVISLPFDVVKLNKAFVTELDNPASTSIVQDTIHMLRMLGKQILVSGIENQDHAELFTKLKYEKKHGCEYLQGFYFSHPLPQSEFVKFLTI